MNNKQLHKLFVTLNRRFFEGQIPEDMSVRFKDVSGMDGCYTKDNIVINSNLRNRRTAVMITLLHEMVHAMLHYDSYIGYAEDRGHGTRFQAGIDRLYKAGAYDGLL
jgi:Zn-dependent peptidase ImmA (M78 family)